MALENMEEAYYDRVNRKKLFEVMKRLCCAQNYSRIELENQ